MTRTAILLLTSVALLEAAPKQNIADPARHPFVDPAGGREAYKLAGEAVNEARLYDFYQRQADYYMAMSPGEGGDQVARGLGNWAVAGFGRRAVRDAGISDKDQPEIKHVEGSIDIAAPMRFNQTADFTTEGLRLDSSRGNWVSDGFKDRLLGVILRVYDPGGKLVFEHRDAKTKDLIWPKPGEEAAAEAPAEPKVKIE